MSLRYALLPLLALSLASAASAQEPAASASRQQEQPAPESQTSAAPPETQAQNDKQPQETAERKTARKKAQRIAAWRAKKAAQAAAKKAAEEQGSGAAAADARFDVPLRYTPVKEWDGQIALALYQSQRGRAREALRIISTMSASGYPPALAAAGKIHLSAKNYSKALSYTRAAANKGYLPALLDMASFYFDGLPEEIEKDSSSGKEWLGKAANLGYVPAMLRMYEICRDGLYDTQADESDAMEWCLKAAKRGDAQAQYTAGMAYRYGRGVPASPDEAVLWLSKAAQQKHGGALAALGSMYKDGEGVEQDYEKAMKYFLAGETSGDPEALYDMGEMYFKGLGVQQDTAKGLRLIASAGNAGYRQAYTELGDLYYQNQDYAGALQNYQQCGMQGDTHCQYRACYIYWAAQGVSQNTEEAYAWCMAGAALGGAEASSLTGEIANYNFLGPDSLKAVKARAQQIIASSMAFERRRAGLKEEAPPSAATAEE